jgi:hypothetical protein
MSDPLVEWDRDVLRAIVASGADGASILEGVDAMEKILLTLAALNGSLGRLISSDLIVSRPDGRYVSPGQADASPGVFRPITPEAYRASVDAYHAAFGNALRELDSESREPDSQTSAKLSGEWRFADDHYATDLELEGINAVLDRIVEALNADGFAAMSGGYSVGPGSVGFTLFGERDDEANLMLRVARPLLIAAAPHGSELAVDEWDSSELGPSWADIAAAFERGSGPRAGPPSSDINER